jgi:outer membrane protein assembly factor BamB
VDSSPAVANGTVYIGSDDNNVYAFGLPGGRAAPVR